jgi:hypothetical protein
MSSSCTGERGTRQGGSSVRPCRAALAPHHETRTKQSHAGRAHASAAPDSPSSQPPCAGPRVRPAARVAGVERVGGARGDEAAGLRGARGHLGAAVGPRTVEATAGEGDERVGRWRVGRWRVGRARRVGWQGGWRVDRASIQTDRAIIAGADGIGRAPPEQNERRCAQTARERPGSVRPGLLRAATSAELPRGSRDHARGGAGVVPRAPPKGRGMRARVLAARSRGGRGG